MKIHDISMMIHKDMPVYNNIEDKRPRVEVVSTYETGSHYESRIRLDIHTGTHLDAPLHMVEGGDTIENIDLYKCITQCTVFDLTSVDLQITKADLEGLDIKEGQFVIFKTKTSFLTEFDFNFVFLEKSAAEYLRDKKIKGVGMDALGVERSQPGHETHKALLGSGIIVLEGLALKDIQPGEYTLIALPLKIQGAEGAPARAVLIEQ
ncbi:MAG: cyclase family protein [Bacillota bacterium]|nr:cyclase family protein [Bacillota bacterium]